MFMYLAVCCTPFGSNIRLPTYRPVVGCCLAVELSQRFASYLETHTMMISPFSERKNAVNCSDQA
jgi:hypothetical protein